MKFTEGKEFAHITQKAMNAVFKPCFVQPQILIPYLLDYSFTIKARKFKNAKKENSKKDEYEYSTTV